MIAICQQKRKAKGRRFFMKRCIKLLLTMVCSIVCTTTVFAENAVGDYVQLCVNGQQEDYVAVYNINGNNYFRLRDVASKVKGTTAQFDVSWNAQERKIEITSGKAYTGAAEVNGAYYETIFVQSSNAAILVDGVPQNLNAYTIQGNTYFKLRDLAELLGFSVVWNGAENTIDLITGMTENKMLIEGGGEKRVVTPQSSKANYAKTSKSYLFDNGDGTCSILDVNGDTIQIDTYQMQDFQKISGKTIAMPLPLFGGFCKGEDGYYIAVGQSDQEQVNKEVIRIIKYDTDFQEVDHVSINSADCFTTIPFDAGSGKMAAQGDELIFHTSRERYLTEDGLNHQSQLTIVVNTDTMTVENDMGRFQPNHVSHSFNQFVAYDGSYPVLVDHGDAYPRSIVLHEYGKSGSPSYDLVEIPGEIGANATGITLGGFAISDSSYMVAYNTIDHQKVTQYKNNEMVGLDTDERNVVVTIQDKNTYNIQDVTLTDFIGHQKLASTPKLVQIQEDCFVVLWNVFDYQNPAQSTLQYVLIDGSGNLLGQTVTMQDMELSYDCQPMVYEDTIYWYINQNENSRILYQIEIS